LREVNMSKKDVHIGTSNGLDLLMHRRGKVGRTDDNVKRGVGVHIPNKYKVKTEQKIKNEIRGNY
jgi:hypothetical protein